MTPERFTKRCTQWRGFEPKSGTWKWDHGDALVKNAAANRIEINAVLMGSPPGAKAVHAFPMDDLDGWSKYVAAVVGRYRKQVRYWEVWNEGNGGFNDSKHTTADYARLAVTTYEAAKKADPDAQVGLTVASFDPAYLHQAILAMKEAKKPNRFDYLCIHPYEIADRLADEDGEIPYLWMTRTLRAMLKDAAPDKADAEVWITEVGRRLGKGVTEQDAAKALVKLYVMALAQGVARTQWFEARDPVGEDQGFGLLNRDGSPRAAYHTLKRLTALLGPTPKYLGWATLGRKERGYGFAFEGKAGVVLVAWMPAGLSDSDAFETDVVVTDAVSGAKKTIKVGDSLEVTDAPVLVSLPPEVKKEGWITADNKFPWGGDHSAAKAVSFQAGLTDANRGVWMVNRANSPTVKFPDGSAGLLAQGDINHPVSFWVHPSFASFKTREYYVRVTVRRVAAGNAGMNLFYAVADSKGRSPYANVGRWAGFSKDAGWQTHTWHVKDACFAKMWGYDITLRPELSVPFAIGKVEVSTEPLK